MNNESTPVWFKRLVWSNSQTVAAVSARRDVIPNKAGVYIFSKTPFTGTPGGILYVGKAANLSTRLPSYLASAETIKIFSRKNPDSTSTSLKHAGKVQLMMEAMHSEGNNVWLTWSCYPQPERLEGALIDWLKPAFNSAPVPILIGRNDPLS